VAERLDHVTGEALAEHEARRRDVEAEPEQRRDEQQRREHREVERLLHEQRREQDHQRQQDVEDDQHVEHRRRHGHDEQQHDRDDADRHGELGECLLHQAVPPVAAGRGESEGAGDAAGAAAVAGGAVRAGRIARGTASGANDSGASTLDTSSAVVGRGFAWARPTAAVAPRAFRAITKVRTRATGV
jgi:hypothetical protein